MLCNCVTNATSVRKFIQHYHFRHGLSATQKCQVQCGQHECWRTFEGVHSLRVHLKRHHPEDPYPQPASTCSHIGSECVEETASDAEMDTDVNELQAESDNAGMSIDDIREMFADFLLVLKSKNVTQTTVDFVCQGFTNVISAITQYCAEPLESDTDSKYSSRLQEVEFMCDSLCLNSSYKIKKYLHDTKGMVEPKEILLGNRPEIAHNDSDNSVNFVPETMQYISVTDTLCKLMCDTDCLKSVREMHTASNADDTISSYFDTVSYKEHPLVNIDRDFLQLQFFYDEFETANPLGSKANIHKLGGLYMSVKNISPSMNSQLRNIFPVIYCYAADVKKYGFDAMLCPLLVDLKALENGVQMTVNGVERTVYAAVVMWSGDNLGLHQIFGFSPNFKANLCCQYCYSSHEDRLFSRVRCGFAYAC